jgi:peptidyl-prolyl cis-trans isomerase D
MVRDRKKAEAILEEARKALAKPGIRPKREFGELARKYSQDPGTAQRGGDLLYFAEDGILGSGEALDKDLVSAAFGLKEVYDLSGVVRSSKGYHVVMLLARRPGENRTLEDAREELRIVLAREKLQKERDGFLDGVMKFEDWTVNSAALANLKITEVEDAPSAVKARANNAQAPDKPSTEEGEDQ